MKNDLTKTLRAAGLKVTPARLAILGVFSPHDHLMSAEQIFQKISGGRTRVHINYVTVYRTLASFVKKGIIKKIDVHRDAAYYELAGHHHHHVVCTNCGVTESFAVCDVGKISKRLLKKSPLFETINQHSLELFGVCRACSK